MKDEAISKSEALKLMDKYIDMAGDDDQMHHAMCVAAEGIKELPALDVAPVVHARWEKWHGDSRHHCTACECYANAQTDAYGYIEEEFFDVYCPNCGARMDGDADA